MKEMNRLLEDLKWDKRINKVLTDQSIPEAERLLLRQAACSGGRAGFRCGKVSGGGRARLGELPEIELALAELHMAQFRFYEAKALLVALDDRGGATDSDGTNAKPWCNECAH
jgi:hypothetical protein